MFKSKFIVIGVCLLCLIAANLSAQVVSAGRTPPAWVSNLESVYNKSQFLAERGEGQNREQAERNAIARIVALFGQQIQVDQNISHSYQEFVRNGASAGWSETLNVQENMRFSSSIDSLIGVEIREIWQDTRSRNPVFHAVAVMDRARTIRIYTEMVQANSALVKSLTTMSDAEKNSFEGYSRFQFAAVIADVNITYGNVLSVLDSPVTGLPRGNEFRQEAQNIIRAIPINVVVRNDRSGRIQGAFAKAFSDLGFRSGGTNSRYILNVDVVISPVDNPNNPNRFVRMELDANLTDTTTRSVVLPYNFSNREGHTTVSEAENRAFMSAERKINEEYKVLLSNYLSQLLPKR
ncbi:MAG: LPP20 family lipoprotein [Treponema sp.]|nr:LPP20 family lipoprotein [Treponema sp.]